MSDIDRTRSSYNDQQSSKLEQSFVKVQILLTVEKYDDEADREGFYVIPSVGDGVIGRYFELPPKSWTKVLEVYSNGKNKKTQHQVLARIQNIRILDMRENGLSYHETVRKYWQTKTRAETDSFRKTVKLWERKYLEEGAVGFMTKCRGVDLEDGQGNKPLPTEAKNDLIAENRRLRARNEYLEAEEERNGRKPGRCPN